MTKLSKSYTSTLTYKVEYSSIPENLIPTKNLSKEISITLKTSGFNILKSAIFRDDKIEIPLDRFQSKNFILSNNNKEFIGALLKDGFEIIHIEPDTLPLYFSKKESKKVAVKLQAKISFEQQYNSIENILIQPDSVVIFGTESVLKEIDFWPTDSLKLIKIKETQEGEIALKEASDLNISIKPKQIHYLQTVEEFTEAEISIPVKIINQKQDADIIIFPKNILFKYQVGLSNYEKSKNDYYEIVADFADINLSSSKSLDLKARAFPSYIKNYKLNPDKVDFILYKD